MKSWISVVAIVTCICFSYASIQDQGLDGDLIGDSPLPTQLLRLSSEYRAKKAFRWSIPAANVTLHAKTCASHGKGLLRARQTECPDGSLMTCPEEPAPCCEASVTMPGPFICCPGNLGCCQQGDRCMGVHGCCASNFQICPNLQTCCPEGSVCCGAICCFGGFQCVNGGCQDPTLSSRSVASVSSRAGNTPGGQSTHSSTTVTSSSTNQNPPPGSSTRPSLVDEPDSSEVPNKSKSRLPIIGGALGGGLGIILLLLIAFILYRRRSKSSPPLSAVDIGPSSGPPTNLMRQNSPPQPICGPASYHPQPGPSFSRNVGANPFNTPPASPVHYADGRLPTPPNPQSSDSISSNQISTLAGPIGD